MESNVGPSAAIRACTAFCAPLPSATIVMTAPTPMMMPSIVRNDRSLFARIAWSATWKISPSSMLGPRGRRLRARRGRLLLLHAGQPADVAHALLHVALRVEQGRARQHQHRVLLSEPAQHLDVVEVRQARADLHGCWLPLLQREHDVAGRLAGVAPEPTAAGSSTTAHLLECGTHSRHRVLLGRRQILTGHALLNCGADLRFAHAWRQLNRPAVRRRHRTPARAPCSGIAARGRVATGDATAQRRAVAVCGGLLLLLVGRELLLDIVGIETQYLRR